ncbi:MAG: aspartate kinase [Candidatus Daviesbacteria bacterium]|nr:aspartate kinase [Candidatus Daviesbacteria bacterium]
MITVPEVVEELVKQKPLLEEGLASDIINLSSLAREFQPFIQKKLYKDIQTGAIVMALKRLSLKLKKQQNKISSLLINIGDITVRSNLVEFTYTNSPTLALKQSILLQDVDQEKSAFLTLTRGVYETTVIISSSLEKEVERVFQGEHLKSKFDNLSAITLILPESALNQSGVYYTILKKLAWEDINFIEGISSMTELTIILKSSLVDKAFSTLKNLS